MSFKAKLRISDVEYNVLNFDFEMSQRIDRNGIPREAVLGNLMEITLEASGRQSEITEWATKDNMKKNGSIIFYRSDAEASGKTFEFKDGFCIYHRDVFDANSATPMKTIIRISVMSVSIDGSFSIASPGFDWKKAGLKFAKSAATAVSGMAAGMATAGAVALTNGEDVKEEDIAKAGIDGAKNTGNGAISSFIPD